MKYLLSDLVNIRKSYIDRNINKLLTKQLPEKHQLILADVQNFKLSENETAKKYFNTSQSGRSFQYAKASIIENTISIIPFINGGDSIQQKKQKIFKSITAIKICALFGFRNVMIPLTTKTLKKCLELGMFHEATDLARILSTHYNVYQIDTIKSKKYHAISMESHELFRLELIFERNFSEVRKLALKNKNADSGIVKKIADDLETKLKSDSVRSHFFYFIIRLTEFQIKKDQAAIESHLKTAISYFENLDYDHQMAKNYFVFQLISSHLNNHKLAQAELIIKSFLDTCDENSHNYHTYNNLLFKIHLFKSETAQALEIYKYLKKAYKKYPSDDFKIRLSIYEVYLSFLDQKKINYRKFNYNLNSAYNSKEEILPFKIIEIIDLYLNENDSAFNKIDALKKMNYRKQFNKNCSKRTKDFIAILYKIINNKKYDISILNDDNMVTDNSVELINFKFLLNIVEKRKLQIA